MQINVRRSLIFWALVGGLLLSVTDAENWPGWRGPQRTGVTSDTGVPISWSPTENVLWKVPMPGTGISNAVVWDDRVFVTASEGRDQGELHVICCDRDSGRERWHQRLWGTAPTLFYPRRPTSRSRNRLT